MIIKRDTCRFFTMFLSMVFILVFTLFLKEDIFETINIISGDFLDIPEVHESFYIRHGGCLNRDF